MRQIIIITLAALFSWATPMTAKNDTMGKKEKTVSVRQVANFTKISLEGYCDVVYTQGNKKSVKVVGLAEDVNRIITNVVNGTLKISARQGTTRRGWFNISDDTKVYVTSPDLVEVTVKGSGDFESERKIDSDNFSITLNGSGDIDIKDIICDNIRLELRGSGDIEIDKLRCATSSIALRGSGDIKVNQNKVRHTNVELYGSGDIGVRMNQCGTVNAKLYGSGDITLSGSAKNLNKSERGSGDIHSRGLSLSY